MKTPYQPDASDLGSSEPDMDDGAMGADSRASGPASGTGVVQEDYGDTAEKGFQCLGKFPLAGGFFSRKPQDGEA